MAAAEGWDDDRLESTLFRRPPHNSEPQRPQPDFASIHQQLQQHSHLTQQLVWEEYRQAHPDIYGYSRFCELYQRWRWKLDVVLRQEQHNAGEKRPREQRRIFEGSLFGPVGTSKRTSFLLSAAREEEDLVAEVFAQGPRWPVNENVPTPQVVVTDAFTGGGAQANRLSTEFQTSITWLLTQTVGRHTLEYGINIPDWSRRGISDRTNQIGTLSFASLLDLSAGRPFAAVLQRGTPGWFS